MCRAMKMKVADALKVLRLKPGALPKEVKAAYYKRARASHPDKGPQAYAHFASELRHESRERKSDARVCACALCMDGDVVKLRGLGLTRCPERKRNRRGREGVPERQGRVRRLGGGRRGGRACVLPRRRPAPRLPFLGLVLQQKRRQENTDNPKSLRYRVYRVTGRTLKKTLRVCTQLALRFRVATCCSLRETLARRRRDLVQHS